MQSACNQMHAVAHVWRARAGVCLACRSAAVQFISSQFVADKAMVGAATCAPAPRSVTAVRARPAARGRGSVVVKAEERGVAQRLEDVKRRVREALPDVEAAGSAPR